MKFCKDCKHVRWLQKPVCGREVFISPVTGEKVYPDPYCSDERRSSNWWEFLPVKPEYCGKDGYYWEKRDETVL